MGVILLSVGLGGGAAVLIMLAGVILGPHYYLEAKAWLPSEAQRRRELEAATGARKEQR